MDTMTMAIMAAEAMGILGRGLDRGQAPGLGRAGLGLAGPGGITAIEEASGSFLKKRTQKLLLIWAMGGGDDKAHGRGFKVFLLLFVHKKQRLLTSPAWAA